MKKLLTLFVAVIGLCTAQAQIATSASLWEKLPAQKGYINDYEHLFSTEEKESLTALLSHFEIDSSVGITIVTISPENTPKERFEELTLHIAKQWGISKDGKPNGILIGISSGYHRIRIQNSDGIVAVLSDKETYDIVQNFFIPEFKKGNYYKGTLSGIGEIMQLLKKRMK
jgi:uncharacterized protein